MTLPERLSQEVERVTVLREQLRRASNPSALEQAEIAVMTAAIHAAHTAQGSGDPIEMIEAIRRLEDFRR